jgi:hypothetical protein
MCNGPLVSAFQV